MTARQLRRVTVVAGAPIGRTILDLDEVELPQVDDLPWQMFALCAETDPDAFFPEKGQPSRPAKQVCQSCLVRSECLQAALDNDERFGVWGGLSERERRSLKSQHRQQREKTLEVAA